MVRAKLQYYYTFKVIPGDGVTSTDMKVEAHKWEEETGEHSGTIYTVRPGHNWMGCNCPAYRRCKHQNCVDEAIQDGKIQELWKWRWDEKNGWQELDDIKHIEELLG